MKLALAILSIALIVGAVLLGTVVPTRDYAAEARAAEQAEALAPLDLALAAAWRLVPLAAVVGGLVSAGRYLWLRGRIVRVGGELVDVSEISDITPAVLASNAAIQLEAARRPSVPYHYAPHLTYQHRQDVEALPAPIGEAHTPAPLPGIVDLANIAHTPTPQSILLALGPGGAPITVPLKQMVHCAFLGATGGGKTNLMRLVLPQILAIGGRVVLADPHFTDVDLESGDDFRPISRRLHMAPAVRPADIDAMLSWLLDELERRLALRRKGQPWGAPVFLALDELPVIIDTVKDVPDRLGKLLREGRKVSLLTIGASQEFLVKVIGGTSAAREAYRTAFYTGGDLVSARALLDMPQRDIAEGALQTGVAYLRSAVTSPAQLVRVPLASNRAIRKMLVDEGGAGSTPQDTIPGAEPTAEPAAEPPAAPRPNALNPRAERVRELMAQKAGINEIIRQVWQVDKKGRPYDRAVDELREVMAELVGGAQ